MCTESLDAARVYPATTPGHREVMQRFCVASALELTGGCPGGALSMKDSKTLLGRFSTLYLT